MCINKKCPAIVFIFGLSLPLFATSVEWQATLDSYGRTSPPAQSISSFSRSDGLNINLTTLQLTATQPSWTVDIIGQLGDYVDRNNAAEPDWAKSIHTARLTVNLTPSAQIELGVLPAHIGLESARSSGNWTVSRSWVAEYSPFYETGVAIGVIDPTWGRAKLLGITGWQQIHDTNTEFSWGTQVILTPNPGTTLGVNTYFGNDSPASKTRVDRKFLDLTWVQDLAQGVALSAVWDLGVQSGGLDANWQGGSIISRWTPFPDHAIAGRFEWFQDPHGAVIANGSTMRSASVNWDMQLAHDWMTRTELRWDDVNGLETITGLYGLSFGIGGTLISK